MSHSIPINKLLYVLLEILDTVQPHYAQYLVKTTFFVWKAGILLNLPEETVSKICTSCFLQGLGPINEHALITDSFYKAQRLYAPNMTTLLNTSPLFTDSHIDSSSNVLLQELLHHSYALISHYIDTPNTPFSINEAISSELQQCYRKLESCPAILSQLEKPSIEDTVYENLPWYPIYFDFTSYYDFSIWTHQWIQNRNPLLFPIAQTVSKVAKTLSSLLNFPTEIQQEIAISGLCHNIGKIGFSEKFMTRQSTLTLDELLDYQTYPFLTLKALKHLDYSKNIIVWSTYLHDAMSQKQNIKRTPPPIEIQLISLAKLYSLTRLPQPHGKAFCSEKSLSLIQHSLQFEYDTKLSDCFHQNLHFIDSIFDNNKHKVPVT